MSSGSASTTGPGRPAVATRNARETSSGMRSALSICATHLAIGAEHAAVVDLLEGLALDHLARRPGRSSRIIGVESWNAVCMPTAAFVAPGPRVTKQMPGRPVSLP